MKNKIVDAVASAAMVPLFVVSYSAYAIRTNVEHMKDKKQKKAK